MCVGCSAVVGYLPISVWVFSGFGEWWRAFFWDLLFVVDGDGEFFFFVVVSVVVVGSSSDLGFVFFFFFLGEFVNMDI